MIPTEVNSETKMVTSRQRHQQRCPVDQQPESMTTSTTVNSSVCLMLLAAARNRSAPTAAEPDCTTANPLSDRAANCSRIGASSVLDQPHRGDVLDLHELVGQLQHDQPHLVIRAEQVCSSKYSPSQVQTSTSGSCSTPWGKA